MPSISTLLVFKYVNSTKHPTGYITPPETQLYTKPAPFMAAFSSRGPNSITPTILKPDITAPGVNIIASWTGAISQTDQVFQTGRNKYYADSGTSMACPHVAGIAGLLKSLHPDWSPAAIRSAMMATARTKDNTGGPMIDATQEKARPFGYGAGHIRPNRAQDPGLVYDLTTDDYLNFLCSLGYNQTQIGAFSEKKTKMTVSRTLKNVGEPGTYTARIRQPVRVRVTVEPKTLQFEKHGEEKTFKLIFNATPGTITDIVFGELLWKDGVHYVRSPIVVG
ncbi:serine protease [Lithospermum erythrorhizon]|uniref:Serine protease n=1 Tax=Lithospermum erythrorhizon TaxID=34254 RepID=A0AAV3PRW5_LITER